MDLNLFATQIAQAGQKSGGHALSGSGFFGGGGLGGTGLDFWNAILGNIAQEVTETKTGNETSDSNIKQDKIKKETVDLALLQLALLGQDPDVNIDQKLAELRIERISKNPENKIEQLTKLIKHLTSGLPAVKDNSASVEELVSRLTKRLENLESSLEAFRSGDFGDEGAPFSLLIATGLNPTQLTKITNRIEEVETKLGRELTVEDLIAGVGNIIPAPGDDDHKFAITDALQILSDQIKKDDAIQNGENADSESTDEKHPEEIMTDLEVQAVIESILDTGSATEDTQQAGAGIANVSVTAQNSIKKDNNDFSYKAAASIQRNNGLGAIISSLNSAVANTDGQSTTASGTVDETSRSIANLNSRLSNADFNALFGEKTIAKGFAAKLNASNLGQQSGLPALAKSGDITLAANISENIAFQNVMSEAIGLDINTGTPFNSAMNAVHAATATPHAGQTHPATQTVAAHMSKAAQKGEGRSITLQLDPPELGRVEVRMEFGKDKSVKAHLVVEKPETYLMLQRDAAALERALQNAGLETDSDSLNYQMAEDNYNFGAGKDGKGSGNGHAGSGQGSSADAEEEVIIETTMTWDVDPETGHVHYSLLA